MKNQRKIDLIVVHCSATRINQDFPVEALEACHKARGFHSIGYHYYITKVYHHYSVPTILQVVTRICFRKKLFYYRF